MNLSELGPQHAQPLDITCNSNWLQSFLIQSRTGSAVRAHAPRSNFQTGQPTQQLAHQGELRTLVAVSPSQRAAVEKLVRRRYAWRGYNLPEVMDRAVEVGTSSEESSLTLLAEHQGALAGTLTLTLDSPKGLLAEQTYKVEIERVRSEGRHICELVKLAMEEGADWKLVLDALLQATYLVARVVHSMTDIFIEVNPRHVRFYQRVFGFTPGTEKRLCARVGAPSVLMHLDLEKFGERLNQYAVGA